MNDRDGQATFGFAPRRGLIEKRAADRSKTVPTKPINAAASATAVENLAPAQPNWIWLLIGVFLGAGGTMVASSFWLQDGHVIRPVIDGDPVAAAAAADRASTGEEPPESIERPAVSPLDEMVAFAAARQPTFKARDREKGALDDRPQASDVVPGGETDPTPKGVVDGARPRRAEMRPTSTRVTGGGDSILSSEADRRQAEEAVASLVRASPSVLNPAPAADRAIAARQDRYDRERQTGPVAEGAERLSRRRPPAAETRTAGPEAPPVVRSTVPSSRPRYRVQVAAVRNQADAQQYWREVLQRLPSLKDVLPIYDRRRINDQTYVRVWIGSFGSRREADAYCLKLQQRGQECFVTRG